MKNEGVTAPVGTDNTPITIGGSETNGKLKEFMHGSVDEVYVYTRALSPQEVKTVMNVAN